jgi:hypothetical protein
MRNKNLQSLKEQAIRKRYEELKSQRKYSIEYIFKNILEPEFFLSKETLQKIIYTKPKTNAK